MASVSETVKLLEDVSTFISFEMNPYLFKIKDELQIIPDNMIYRVTQKLNEIYEDDPFKFKTTILNLILIHEYTEAKDYTNALNVIKKMKEQISRLIRDECEDLLFKKAALVLRNICTTYEIFIISHNDVENAHKLSSDIVPFSDLNKESEAALYGIRSSVLMEYGLYGNKFALNYAKKANLTDPDNPYWFFLIGKCLGRIRRVEKPYDIPSSEEINVLKQAIKMDENYLFTLFTAEVYAETANRTYKFHSRNGTLYPHLKFSIDQLTEEASVFYRKCIEKQPDCTHVLFRVAKGFMSLPYPQKDVAYAKELLLKGLKIAPRNPFGNHQLAKYYERYDNNMELAMEHLKICAEQNVFGAHMDMLKIEFQRNKVDVEKKLTDLLTVFVETPRKFQILTQLASYYIFVNPNLVKACELMKECVVMNYDDNIVNHRSIFVQLKEPFSLIDVLIDEIKIEMERKCTSEKLSVYKDFLNCMTESNITLSKGRAKNLKDKILLEEKELKSKYSQGKGKHKKNTAGRNFNRSKSTTGNRIGFSKGRPAQQSVSCAESSNVQNERMNTLQKTCNFFDSWKQDIKSSESEKVSEEILSQSDLSIKKGVEKPAPNEKENQTKNSSAPKNSFNGSRYFRDQRNRFNTEKANGSNKLPDAEKPALNKEQNQTRNSSASKNSLNGSRYFRDQRNRFNNEKANCSNKLPDAEKPALNEKQNQTRNSLASKNSFKGPKYFRDQRNRFNNEKPTNKLQDIVTDFDCLKISSNTACASKDDNASQLSSDIAYKNQKSLDVQSDTDDDDLITFLRGIK